MQRLIKSFKYAFTGLFNLIAEERNFQIHIIAFVTVVILGVYFNISSAEWISIWIISAIVLAAEGFNSALEKTCDLISKEHHPQIKKIKDIAAGATLITALFAAGIGCSIFWKYIFG